MVPGTWVDGRVSRDGGTPGSPRPRLIQGQVKAAFPGLVPQPRGAAVRARGKPASGTPSRAPRPGEAHNFPASTPAPRRGLPGRCSRERKPRGAGRRGSEGRGAAWGRAPGRGAALRRRAGPGRGEAAPARRGEPAPDVRSFPQSQQQAPRRRRRRQDASAAAAPGGRKEGAGRRLPGP